MAEIAQDKREIFESMPVPKALATLAIPTIISQMISVIYNMVDALYIGRTGNPYMMASTTVTLSLMLVCISFANLFGVGGGSLIARLMGEQRTGSAKYVSSFSFYGAAAVALVYSLLVGLFLRPILFFLGASDQTVVYASQYAFFVVVLGCIFSTLSLTMAQLLRNVGYSGKAGIGLGGGGIMNMILDPIFMFVILPPGKEVMGAAIATLISNFCACTYLLFTLRKVCKTSPLSLSFSDARKISKGNIKKIFIVGIPSAILSLLFDVANVACVKIASAHNDMVVAAIGITAKIERIPNAINGGLSQGMMPLVAYNFAAKNKDRMNEIISFTRFVGLGISAFFILILQLFARPFSSFFLNTSTEDPAIALATLAYATTFLRIRSFASPFQFLNYSNSFGMQAMGNGRGTMIHAIARELVFYIPFMYILDKIFGEKGLAAALPVGEFCGAIVALILIHRTIKQAEFLNK